MVSAFLCSDPLLSAVSILVAFLKPDLKQTLLFPSELSLVDIASHAPSSDGFALSTNDLITEISLSLANKVKSFGAREADVVALCLAFFFLPTPQTTRQFPGRCLPRTVSQ